jgi:branched-chain amino acid aminotransferase
LVKINSMPDCVLRLTVSRGSAPRGYSIKLAQKPRVLMILHPLPARPDKGWRLVTSSLRVLANDPLMQFKTCSRIRSVMSRVEAEEKDADEALLLNERGELAEGAVTNVFWVDGQTVCSPPLAASILPGVTRGIVFELCRKRQIEAVERSIQPAALHEAEAVFLTVSTAGIVEATSLNGKPLRRHPIVNEIKSAYRDLVAAETKQTPA